MCGGGGMSEGGWMSGGGWTGGGRMGGGWMVEGGGVWLCGVGGESDRPDNWGRKNDGEIEG